MTILYSWQSDLSNKFNRSLIKVALEKAAKELNGDLGLEELDRKIEVDHDTKGVTGMPDLASTIFDKIAQCTVFVADVSFIGKNEAGDRFVPNPNVMIELGYALAKLGSDRVVCVMNTAHGEATELPFDLKHKRHPIQYNLGDHNQADKSEVSKELQKTLKSAIQPILDIEQYRQHDIVLPSNPSRKEIFDALMASDSKDDWERLSFNDRLTVYSKQNVNLRLELEYSEVGTQCERFEEPWAIKHPDPHATGYWCHLYYGATHIDTYVLVSVDGGRAMLPLPESRDKLTVNPLYYKVAQICDTGGLDEYMMRSGLTFETADLAVGYHGDQD